MAPARGFRIALSGALLIVAVAFAARFASISAAQVAAPFDLNYETAAYASVEIIATGRNPYDPGVYAQPPFVLTMYTPLYFHLVEALPEHHTNVFYTGRLVSLASALIAASTILVAAGGRRWGVGMVGVGFFVALWPVSQWAAYVKSDMLALAFSALAVTAAHLARGRGGMLVLAAFCSVAAIASKQSYVAAALAIGFHLLLTDRRAFGIYASSGALLGGGFLLFAALHWGPGFWFSTLSATGQEITLSWALRLLPSFGPKPLVAIVCFSALALAWRQCRREGVAAVERGPYLLYAALACGVCALTIGKKGADTNYLIEPWLATLLWTVFALRGVSGAALERPRAAAVMGLLVLASLVELASARPLDHSWRDARLDQRRMEFYARLRQEVDALGFESPSLLSFHYWDAEPEFRIWAQAKTYQVTNRVNLNDAFLYRMLWDAGVLEIESMVQAIEQQAFDVIVVPKEKIASNPPYPVLTSALRRHYRLASTGERHRYWLRRAREAD